MAVQRTPLMPGRTPPADAVHHPRAPRHIKAHTDRQAEPLLGLF